MLKRTGLRLGTIAVAGAMIFVGAAAPAFAYTSFENTPRGGFVWYNAGTHNMSKGRNSFTVLDVRCNGWRAFVYYEVRNPATQGIVKSGEVVSSDCGGEVSASIFGVPPGGQSYTIKWVPGEAGSGSDREYGYWRYDTVS
jgi:hypothetical protein